MMLATVCSICGASPCYAICRNSPEYYSPERELDDAIWSDGFPYRDPSLLDEDYCDHEAYDAEMNAVYHEFSDSELVVGSVAEEAKWVSNHVVDGDCDVHF